MFARFAEGFRPSQVEDSMLRRLDRLFRVIRAALTTLAAVAVLVLLAAVGTSEAMPVTEHIFTIGQLAAMGCSMTVAILASLAIRPVSKALDRVDRERKRRADMRH